MGVWASSYSSGCLFSCCSDNATVEDELRVDEAALSVHPGDSSEADLGEDISHVVCETPADVAECLVASTEGLQELQFRPQPPSPPPPSPPPPQLERPVQSAMEVAEAMRSRIEALFPHGKPPPASEAALQTIRDVSFEDPTVSTCSVCLNEVCAGEGSARLPACGHVFHKECVKKWLLCSAICPVCRCEVREPGAKVAPGVVARVIDLANSTSLNGHKVVVQQQVAGCWQVRFSDEQVKRLKARHLVVVSKFCPQARVRVTGLAQSKELNGEEGRCVRWEEAAFRWVVKLGCGERKIRPANLELLEEPAHDARDAASIAMGAMSDPSFINGCMQDISQMMRAPEVQQAIPAVVDAMASAMPAEAAARLRQQAGPSQIAGAAEQFSRALAADPGMVQRTMAQAHAAAMANPAMIAQLGQLMSNPSMRTGIEQLTSNPSMRAQMEQLMGQR